jgi:signal transduction histidine kinase
VTSHTNQRAERRRGAPREVLERRGLEALLVGVRVPLKRALEVLGRRRKATGAAWCRLLRRLAPGRDEFEPLSRLRLDAHYQEHLKNGDEDAFVQALRQEGRSLAADGVPADQAVAAIALHLESGLGQLLAGGTDERAVPLSLARLAGVAQSALLGGYAEGRVAGWQRLDDSERLKLSRDLHDEIGADLVVLKLYVEMMALELGHGNVDALGPKLQEALDLVSRTIESVRRLTLDLGPAMLEQVGFLPAVRLYCRRFASRTGIRIEVHDAGMPGEIPSSHETALYRVMQGALSNVVKHSRARQVRLSVGGYRDAVVVMIIEDDGAGFDPRQRSAHGGFGLTAMRERIQSLGGRLHVESRTTRSSRHGPGTRIEIDLPLRMESGP